jgi:hypothetical protein
MSFMVAGTIATNNGLSSTVTSFTSEPSRVLTM